jgi:hypothetical protein
VKLRKEIINESKPSNNLHRMNISKSGTALPVASADKKVSIIAYQEKKAARTIKKDQGYNIY